MIYIIIIEIKEEKKHLTKTLTHRENKKKKKVRVPPPCDLK